MPDQYTLDAFQRLELAPSDRTPVMAEIDLVSSHHPWTPLPQHGRLVERRRRLGLRRHAGAGRVRRRRCCRDPDAVRSAYGESIEYSLSSAGLVRRRPTATTNLVLVVLGDHQPHSIVSGDDAGHDVPITRHRPRPGGAGPDRRAGAGRTACGPTPDAPVWPMDAFRDRFLTAYGPR